MQLFPAIVVMATTAATPGANAGSAASCTMRSTNGPLDAGVFIAVLYILFVIVTKRINPLWMAIGDDGRLSSSKLQFFVWTAVTIYTYVGLAVDRLGHVTCAGGVLPRNVLLAMGLSLTTAVAAKVIVVGYQNTGQKPAPNLVKPTLDLKYLVMSDSGVPDLTKIQMLAWTGVAVFVYLLDLSQNFAGYVTCSVGAGACFPDIDTSLMVLMGLGQGAYLGFKLVPAGADDSAATSAQPQSDSSVPLHDGNVGTSSNAGIGKDLLAS